MGIEFKTVGDNSSLYTLQKVKKVGWQFKGRRRQEAGFFVLSAALSKAKRGRHNAVPIETLECHRAAADSPA